MRDDKSFLERTEFFIGRVLRVSVIIATITIVLGLMMLCFSAYKAGNMNVSEFSILKDLSTMKIQEFFRGVSHFKAGYILFFGIFLLILTPIIRVIAVFFSFLIQKDRVYAIISGIVIVLLVISLFI